MRGRIRRSATVMTTVALAALLAIPAGSAFAKGGPPTGVGGGKGGPAVGGGGGGGGGGGEETLSNNLSVPAIFVGSNPFGITCSSVAADPTGTPATGYEVAGYYYVQGIHKWQAACVNGATEATAMAEWGDNLTGDAKLSVGSPIRVEVGLNAGDMGLDGFTVVKLQTSLLDRNSAYGTEAVGPELNAAPAQKQVPYSETRVWAAGATMTIVGPGANISQAASAEINATGRVVYGYNLRVTAAGVYTITFTFPNVSISGADAGTVNGSSVSLDITVAGGGGGGGGGRK